MKYLYFFALTCLLTFGALAQSTLSGSIMDIETNEPLIVTIYIPKFEKGTISDVDGNYTIDNIPAGSYSVVYSLLGVYNLI